MRDSLFNSAFSSIGFSRYQFDQLTNGSSSGLMVSLTPAWFNLPSRAIADITKLYKGKLTFYNSKLRRATPVLNWIPTP